MTTTRYYRATETTARPATNNAKARAASTLQARRSTHATAFSPDYPTTVAEVARLMAIGSFVEVHAP